MGRRPRTLENLVTEPGERPSALFVVRRARGPAQGGDRIHINRMIPFLSERMTLQVVTLEYGGLGQRLRDLLRGWPVEVCGYYSAANRATLAQALKSKPGYVYLIHESTFAFGALAASTGATPVLFSMNSIATLMATGGSLPQSLLAPLGYAYERRYFCQPGSVLTVVSRLDARALRETLGVTTLFPVVAPGILPPVALKPGAVAVPELVITGSYAWWRKRNDLKRFARQPPALPIWTQDDVAEGILGDRGKRLPASMDWSDAIRFGVITDRFLGGFKLKALEYVANNCIVLSYCDIRPEFTGIPHADEFVRLVESSADIEREIAALTALEQVALVSRYEAFKAGCALRFDWDRCLAALAPPFQPDPELDDPADHHG